MLRIIKKMGQIRFSDLMHIYEESNMKYSSEKYPSLSALEQQREAELDFYEYLRSVFFCQDNAVYAIWEENGDYVAALRLEPYRDGILLNALETAPDYRKRGFATLLLKEVQAYLMQFGNGKLYSHVSKDNAVSLAVHKTCGFLIIKDHAVFVDGSVYADHVTMLYTYEKAKS